jgi:hypothetical protein
MSEFESVSLCYYVRNGNTVYLCLFGVPVMTCVKESVNRGWVYRKTGTNSTNNVSEPGGVVFSQDFRERLELGTSMYRSTFVGLLYSAASCERGPENCGEDYQFVPRYSNYCSNSQCDAIHPGDQ